MAGMQHNMTPAQMAKMPSGRKEMPNRKGMDHSNMAGMDHDNMTSMSDSKSAMPSMKKEAMPEMRHEEMAGHDHGESMSNDKQPNHHEGVQDESQPHEHPAAEESEHKTMAMNSMTPATQATPWQIIPNPHPMVVHFPIALTIVAFLLSIAAYARRSHPVSLQLAAAGHFTLWLAAISATVAVLFGWLAYNSVNHDEAGHVAMLLHRSWAVPTALGLMLLASWDAWKYRINELISVPMLFVLLLLAQSIAVTGWLGGEVVYRHGIGVLALPASEGAGHSHHHNHDSTEPAEHLHEESTTHPDESADHHHEENGEAHEH